MSLCVLAQSAQSWCALSFSHCGHILGGGQGKTYSLLSQEYCHGFSARWESRICEIKLNIPGFWAQDLHLFGVTTIDPDTPVGKINRELTSHPIPLIEPHGPRFLVGAPLSRPLRPSGVQAVMWPTQNPFFCCRFFYCWISLSFCILKLRLFYHQRISDSSFCFRDIDI